MPVAIVFNLDTKSVGEWLRKINGNRTLWTMQAYWIGGCEKILACLLLRTISLTKDICIDQQTPLCGLYSKRMVQYGIVIPNDAIWGRYVNDSIDHPTAYMLIVPVWFIRSYLNCGTFVRLGQLCHRSNYWFEYKMTCNCF